MSFLVSTWCAVKPLSRVPLSQVVLLRACTHQQINFISGSLWGFCNEGPLLSAFSAEVRSPLPHYLVVFPANFAGGMLCTLYAHSISRCHSGSLSFDMVADKCTVVLDAWRGCAATASVPRRIL